MAELGPDRRTRILAIHRYFWPDTPPYAAILRAVAARWSASGHEVEVLASQPSYKAHAAPGKVPAFEKVDGISVRRLPMRPDAGPRGRKFRNMLRFTLWVFLMVIFGRRRDVVMCSTAPQVLLGWFVSLAARVRGTKFVYHCMDIHPEIGRLSGEFANPWIFRILLAMDTATCRRAVALVVLSEDMKTALTLRDASLANRIVVLNNFDLPDYETEGTTALPDFDGLTIAFTGNLGRFQALESVAEAVLSDFPGLDRIRCVFMGDGAARPALESAVADAPSDRRSRILLLPHGTSADARAVMRAADLGIVSLSPGVIRYAYPSKTATYLSEGLPVLAFVEPDSELARNVRDWGIGAVVGTSASEIRDALLDWSERLDEIPAMREVASAVWQREFSAPYRLNDWDDLLKGTGEVSHG